jgi:RHH-type transcriptional regulator, rel operon repressor / antitoxin RelB
MPPETLKENLDLNERHIAGIKRAIASLDRGEGVPHEEVKAWVESSGRDGKEIYSSLFARASRSRK